MLGLSRPAWTYLFLELLLSTLRGVLWFFPFFSSTVVWRGNVLRLRERSRIEIKTRAAAETGSFDTQEHHAPA